jgi:hypothetical protein
VLLIFSVVCIGLLSTLKKDLHSKTNDNFICATLDWWVKSVITTGAHGRTSFLNLVFHILLFCKFLYQQIFINRDAKTFEALLCHICRI